GGEGSTAARPRWMLGEGDQPGARTEIGQEDLCVGGVFGRVGGRLAQGRSGAGGEVVEVAERRRHDIQGARHLTTSPATAGARRTRPIATRSGARGSPRVGS